MQISIIPADKTIVVDGEALQFDFSIWSNKIRAIQWNGASGVIEFKLGADQWFDNFEMISELVDAYNAEKARVA